MTVEELIQCLINDIRYTRYRDEFINLVNPYNPIKINIKDNIAYFTLVDSKTGVSIQYAISIPYVQDYDIFNQVATTLLFGIKEISSDINLIFKEDNNEENRISE